jgi:hypothetical protein
MWWDKIKAFLLGLGENLYKFFKSEVAYIVKKHGEEILSAVLEAAAMKGLSGQEKMALVAFKLATIVPNITERVARGAIEVIYNTWMDEQEDKLLDSDGDGVPDYKDLCKDLGLEVTGCVDENGCPVECPPAPEPATPSPDSTDTGAP